MSPTQDSELHIDDNPYSHRKPLGSPKDADFWWAREHPGEWSYFVDPRADKSALDFTNVLGGRRADDNGGFAEEWVNPDFVPVPDSRDVEFVNELELVMWRLIWGFNNLGRFIDAFSRSNVIIVLPEDDPQGQRGWPIHDGVGFPKLDVYTSAGRLPNGVNPWLRRSVAGREIIEQVGPREGVFIRFHSGNEDDPLIPASDLTRFWAEWREAEISSAAAESGEE